MPAFTLDTWTTHDWSHGVLLPHLAPHDQLIVRTRNTTYEIIVVVPHTASVAVRGGAFFPTFTPAQLAGSSLGGRFRPPDPTRGGHVRRVPGVRAKAGVS